MNKNIISNSILNNFISTNFKENDFSLLLSVTERVHKTFTLRECQSHNDNL